MAVGNYIGLAQRAARDKAAFLAQQQGQQPPQGALAPAMPPAQAQQMPPAAPPMQAAPVSLPGIATMGTPPPNPASSAIIAASPQRSGYSPAIMAALARNQPGLRQGTPSPGAAPVQPAPYNRPTPLTVTKSPDPVPPPSPGVLAAREAQAAGDRSGLPNSVSEFLFGGSLGLDPFGTHKRNSTPIEDIGRAMAGGKAITDVQWAQAGYGPGGTK